MLFQVPLKHEAERWLGSYLPTSTRFCWFTPLQSATRYSSSFFSFM